jgi:TfoX/Sxy family transcriptional regulator of competence genes
MGQALDFLKELLDGATERLPDVTLRRAFGSWGYYVNDRIFAVAYAREDRLGVKLPDGDAYASARSLPGASEWAPRGSPMSDWVLLPEALHDDGDAVREWVVRAFELVRAAPEKSASKPGAGTRTRAKGPSKRAPAAANRQSGGTKPSRRNGGR